MSVVLDQLNAILANVRVNKTQLETQIPNLETQLKGARDQLAAIDALIATLETGTVDEAFLGLVEAQVAANALSPTPGAAVPAANEGVAPTPA